MTPTDWPIAVVSRSTSSNAFGSSFIAPTTRSPKVIAPSIVPHPRGAHSVAHSPDFCGRDGASIHCRDGHVSSHRREIIAAYASHKRARILGTLDRPRPPARSTARIPARSTSRSRRAGRQDRRRPRGKPTTAGFICAKVRRFGERVYGEDRLLYPAVRKGAKGQGVFTRVTWDEALDLIASKDARDPRRHGREAILPFCYGGSNGLLTQDTNDAALFRGFGTSRLARTVCAAPTGAANLGLYGKMAGVAYADYVHARLIVLWGVNPSASGIHLVPVSSARRARRARRWSSSTRARRRSRDRRISTSRRSPAPTSPSRSRSTATCSRTATPTSAFSSRTHARRRRLRARAAEWTIERAAADARIDRIRPPAFRRDVRRVPRPRSSAAAGGSSATATAASAAAAILALPAVGGKFGVRGGGFSMSNSAAFGIKAAAWMNDTPEPPTRLVNMNQLGRALTEFKDPPVEMLFVYNCNPLATMPDQNRVLEGLKREDLFTVVFEQVMTDTARYADVLLPATTFLENYDIAKAYGPISLQLVRPVDRADRRSAAEHGSVLGTRRTRSGVGTAEEETDTLLRITSRLPPAVAAELMRAKVSRHPPFGGVPIQFVDVFPLTPRPQGRSVPGGARRVGAAGPVWIPARSRRRNSSRSRSSRRPARRRSPRRSASCASVPPCCRCTRTTPTARGLATDDPVRVFNELGEVQCPVAVDPDDARRDRQPVKGPVAQEHLQRLDLERARRPIR